MRQAVWAMLFIALLLAPAMHVFAKPLASTTVSGSIFSFGGSSSTLAKAYENFKLFLKIKAFLDRVNAWFKDHLGIDLYSFIENIVKFVILVYKTVIKIVKELLTL